MVASYYTVVQYVPRPVAGERVNLGLIAYAGDKVVYAFRDDFNRARVFGAEDVTYLKEVVEELKGAIDAGEADAGVVERLVHEWNGSVQFTAPRASLRDPEELLGEIQPLFLVGWVSRPRNYRDRRAAVTLALRTLRGVLSEESRSVVKRGVSVVGEFDEHKFDVGAVNGRVVFAAQGISFEMPERKVELIREIDATAWMIDDVRRVQPELSISVIALPPRGKSSTYDKA